MTAAHLQRELRADPDLAVHHRDGVGRLAYSCSFEGAEGEDGHDHHAHHRHAHRRSLLAPSPSSAPASGPDPDVTDAASVFKLHSRPGAPNTLLLDFTGHTVVNTEW